MIPRDNLQHLVIKEEVVEAVRAGLFGIYAVATIDEGIEVLTGVAAGEHREDGTYSEGTVHYLVEQRLREMARKAREFGKPEADDSNDEEDKKG